MDKIIKATILPIFVHDNVAISDSIAFEVYTRLRVTPEQTGELNGKRFKPILNLSYCYIESKEGSNALNKVFDIIFMETLKYRELNNNKSSIDNYGQ